MEKTALLLEPLLAEETRQLLIRYSTLNTNFRCDPYDVYRQCVLRNDALAGNDPVWDRVKFYEAFNRAPEDLRHHQMPYVTLAEAVSIAEDMKLGQHENVTAADFYRHERVLSEQAEGTARHTTPWGKETAKL